MSTSSDKKSDNEHHKFEDEQDYPIVLICFKCGNILGDSCSWICANKDLKTVTLQRVTNTVDSEQDLVTSEKGIDIGSTYRQLYCVMCDEILGRVYQTTPQTLDNLRNVFTFNVNKIQSYQIGSGEKTAGVDTDNTADLQSIQDDLYKIKTTICALNQRIVNIENSLRIDDQELQDENGRQDRMEEKVADEKKLDKGSQRKSSQRSTKRNIAMANSNSLKDIIDEGSKTKLSQDSSPPRGKRKRTK